MRGIEIQFAEGRDGLNGPGGGGPAPEAAGSDPPRVEGSSSGGSRTFWTPAADRAWYVLHTKSRQEKTVAEHLAGLGIEHYLPMVLQERYYGHRRRRVYLPLFSSYVFMRGSIEDRFAAVNTGRLAKVLDVPEQGVFEHELSQIRAAIEAGVGLDPYPFLKVGHWVRVRSGPLQGVEGLVEDRKKPDRLVLQVRMLGRATSVEISPSLLEPLD